MANPEPQSGSINRYYITREEYKIDPRYLGRSVKLGDGINMRNPLNPQVAPRTAFEPLVRAPRAEVGLPKSSDVIQETTVLKESLSEREEGRILSGYFKASYGLSSVQAAYETATHDQQSYHTIYALLEHSGESDVLPDSLQSWRAGDVPLSESIADQDEALLQFLLTYGSHYVSAISYGLRIAIQGKMSKSSQTQTSDFSAAFKAAFGSFGAEAGVRMQQEQKMNSMQVDLLLEVSSGGHTGGLLVCRTFSDINKLLDDAKSDAITFAVAPIEATLKPYWPILDPKWTKTRALLNPLSASFKTPGAPFGVPKGTIIAWHPTPDYVENLDSASSEATVVAPAGWAICDGALGTPDLRGLFIRGAATWTTTPATGGAESHNHGGATANDNGEETGHGGSGSRYRKAAHPHTHNIIQAGHLPPYVALIYIMKVNDVP